MGHQEQPRSLRYHLLSLDARYPGRALTSSRRLPCPARVQRWRFPLQSPASPHSVRVLVPALQLDFLETHGPPGWGRLSGREATAVLHLCPTAASQLGTRGTWSLAERAETEVVAPAQVPGSPLVLWVPLDLCPQHSLL